MLHYYALWLLSMNLICLVLMAVDKKKAKRGAWRIPGKTLFFIAALGGSPGGWIGMYLFHHKTRHSAFVIGFPALTLLHAGLAVWLVTTVFPL